MMSSIQSVNGASKSWSTLLQELTIKARTTCDMSKPRYIFGFKFQRRKKLYKRLGIDRFFYLPLIFRLVLEI